MRADCTNCGKLMIWDSDAQRYYCTCSRNSNARFLAGQEGLFIPIYKDLNPTGKWRIDSEGTMYVEHRLFLFWREWINENRIV